MKNLNAAKALFIKLGEKGYWEQSAITKEGVIKIGYSDINTKDCINGNWSGINDYYIKKRKISQIAATGFITQLRYFFEEPNDTIWITFYNNKLWWGKASTKIDTLSDGTRVRNILGGWSDEDLKGRKLLVEYLRGSLTKIQGFRGTICNVDELEYLLTKINGNVTKEISEAYDAYDKLIDKISKLIKTLNWKDFELLIDLIFRNAGYNRNATIGKSTKFLDLSLFQPVTNEKTLVQIKAQSNFKEFDNYYNDFKKMQEYDKFFFVVHTTTDEKLRNFQKQKDVNILLIDEISKLVIDSGLTNWVITKTS
jgi:hypothetical protein